MKRLLCLLMTLCLLTGMAAAVHATEVEPETEIATEGEPAQTEPTRQPGQCGETLNWSFSGGVLTVSGSGKMDDFSENAPWHAHKGEIKSVVLEGVTYIGANAFRNYDALESVNFGSALYEIGPNAFRSCDGLTRISLPASFKVFGESSFMSCKNLTRIDCAGRFPTFRQNSMWDTYTKIYYPADRPWSASTIEELETAFRGRIEFLASDGKDPVPNEPEETQPIETQPEETQPEETVPETTEGTTQPVEPEQTPPEDTVQPEPPREDAGEQEETGQEPEAPEKNSGLLRIVLTAIGVLAALIAAVLLLLLSSRPRGRYTGKKRRRR